MATATAPAPAPVARPKVRRTQMLIDGQWCDAASGETFGTYHPATEEKIADVAVRKKEYEDRKKAEQQRAKQAAERAGARRRATGSSDAFGRAFGRRRVPGRRVSA